MTTCGEFLVKQLEAWGVETVFGIPGVHTVELYRGLPGSRIRHVTPRHEQGAGFMADGYARVTGKPGVCFIITGPGMTNILTAMAQAYADSIPMLVISSVNERARLAHGNGYLHELPNQRNLLAPLREAAARLRNAKKPLLLLGGGCVEAAAEARALAAALDAPTALTINAKGLLPADHPLLLGSNQSCVPVRELAAEADVVLAIGTELGETDYDVVFDGGFALDGELIRIDIDPQQLMRNYTPSLAIHSDARLAMRVLLAELPGGEASPDSPGARRAAAVRQRLAEDFAGWSHYRQLFAAILAEWPDARFVGDSTQTVYSGNHLVDLDEPRRWFNASTGYGTLGYGLPAAIGAKLGEPGRPVVSLMGDGGLQFTLPELASAVEAKVGIVVLLWNNHGYGEIKRYMERREITPLGVDIYTPDFLAIARGFGCAAERARDLEHLRELLRGAPADRPLIVEVLQAAPFHP
ncbi:hypothetical protein FA198_16245 [Pseudomonas aeruginosa]|nr:hypothetical protein [Pseudomonas aeruginosa]